MSSNVWVEKSSEVWVEKYVPPLDIYVEFYLIGMLRPNFGVTAQLCCGPLKKVETVFHSLGFYNPDTGSVLGTREKIYLPREVLRWRQTTQLRGRMGEYQLELLSKPMRLQKDSP